jgi:hypothetical protein
MVGIIAAAALSCYVAFVHAQSSPLTIQPSTSRVGVNTTNPGYSLDVNGTVNAASFRGDGSQLTNLPSSGGNILGGYGSRGQASVNNATTPNTQYDLKADVVILYKVSDQTTVVRHNPGTITNNVSTAGPAANGRDQGGVFPASSWIHFYWIWNGTSLATISSLTPPPTGPILPSGYTHWSYAGAVFFNSSSQLVKTRIRGDLAEYEGYQVALSNGAATTETAISLANFAPSNAVTGMLWMVAKIAHGSTNNDGTVTVRQVSGTDHIILTATTATGNSNIRWFARTTVETAIVGQQILYLWSDATPSVKEFDVRVLGYRLPNGGA